MTRTPSSVIVIIAVLLAVLGGIGFAAQDKYTVKVPNGLALSEFRGYENWQDVAVSQTETSLKVIVANPAMIGAYRNGIPGNGKHFPEGSKIVKTEWAAKKSAESPYFVMVPDTLKTVSVIEKMAGRQNRTAPLPSAPARCPERRRRARHTNITVRRKSRTSGLLTARRLGQRHVD
jgi:hypothetical protein